jgi:hydrogenase maturation protein HypF
MAKEPRLSALSISHDITEVNEILSSKFTSTEFKIYQKTLKKGSNIQSSSVGRLFDAVASIIGIMDIQTFEGEAAMHLEVKGRSYCEEHGYNSNESYWVDTNKEFLSGGNLILAIIQDLKKSVPIEAISAKFHMTLVHWIKSVAVVNSIKKIGFSGGVFQNSLLVDLLIHNLENDYELLFHQELSPNDENISFGQLIYAEINARRP